MGKGKYIIILGLILTSIGNVQGYGSQETDIDSANRKIHELERRIEDLESDLEKQKEKQEIRALPAIPTDLKEQQFNKGINPQEAFKNVDPFPNGKGRYYTDIDYKKEQEEKRKKEENEQRKMLYILIALIVAISIPLYIFDVKRNK